MVEIGQEGQDVITGFKGICTGRVRYISGCNQTLLTPGLDVNGTFKQSEWFDDQRIFPVEGGRTVTLDNSETPGPERQAPKR